MKKIFISQPVAGKSEEEILQTRENALVKVKDYVKRTMDDNFVLIDTYFSDFNGNPVEFLGKAISEGLAKADLCVFLPGWENTNGCRCEHFIATQYNVPKLYINEL